MRDWSTFWGTVAIIVVLGVVGWYAVEDNAKLLVALDSPKCVSGTVEAHTLIESAAFNTMGVVAWWNWGEREVSDVDGSTSTERREFRSHAVPFVVVTPAGERVQVSLGGATRFGWPVTNRRTEGHGWDRVEQAIKPGQKITILADQLETTDEGRRLSGKTTLFYGLRHDARDHLVGHDWLQLVFALLVLLAATIIIPVVVGNLATPSDILLELADPFATPGGTVFDSLAVGELLYRVRSGMLMGCGPPTWQRVLVSICYASGAVVAGGALGLGLTLAGGPVAYVLAAWLGVDENLPIDAAGVAFVAILVVASGITRFVVHVQTTSGLSAGLTGARGVASEVLAQCLAHLASVGQHPISLKLSRWGRHRSTWNAQIALDERTDLSFELDFNDSWSNSRADEARFEAQLNVEGQAPIQRSWSLSDEWDDHSARNQAAVGHQVAELLEQYGLPAWNPAVESPVAELGAKTSEITSLISRDPGVGANQVIAVGVGVELEDPEERHVPHEEPTSEAPLVGYYVLLGVLGVLLVTAVVSTWPAPLVLGAALGSVAAGVFVVHVPRRRVHRLPIYRTRELTIADGALVLGDERIHLDAPFTASMSRSADKSLVQVEFVQPHTGVDLAFSFPGRGPLMSELPERDLDRAVPVPSWDVASAWTTLRARAASPEELAGEANRRLTALRGLLFSEPSEDAWQSIVELLDYWPLDSLQMGLDYAIGALDHWPAKLRPAPQKWLHDLTDNPNPRLAVVGLLSFRDGQPTVAELRTLKSAGVLRHVRAIDLANCHLTVEHLEALFDGAQFDHLQDLDLARNNLLTPGVRYLASARSLSALRTLDLQVNRLGDVDLRLLLGSRHLKALSRLEIGGQGFTPRGVTEALRHRKTKALVFVDLDFQSNWTSTDASNVQRHDKSVVVKVDF